MNKRTFFVSVAMLLCAALAAAAAPVPASTPARAQSPSKPLTLKQALEMALNNSSVIAIARLRANIAEGQTRVTRSAFLPNIYTGSGAAYSYGFPSMPGGQAPSVFSLSYVQKLFDPPARGVVKADQARTREQRVAIETARDQVILQAASDYLQLNEIRRSLELLQEERKSAAEVVQVTAERVGAGLELPMDETQAQLSQAQVEQHILSLQNTQDLLDDDLRSMMGLPEDAPIVVTDAQLPPETTLTTPQLMTLALAHSPGIHQAELESQAQLDLLKGQRGGYWPTVDLVGQYMILSKFNNYDQFYRNFQRNNLNVGVQVNIPIFQSRTSAAIDLASNRYQEAQEDLGNQRRDLEIQVRQEKRQTLLQDAARQVARLELKLAQEQLQVVQSQYNQGQATLAAVEKSRLDESEKWLNFLKVSFDGQEAQLKLMRTTGQLAQLLR